MDKNEANSKHYRELREKAKLTREKASYLMDGLSASRIEKIENGQEPTPYDIVQMAVAYKSPDLCNYYCTHGCKIGETSVPEIEVSQLPNIVLQTIESLNDIYPLIQRMISIAKDGKVSEDEIEDFARISTKLEEISLASDALNLWVEKTIIDNELDAILYRQAKEKIKGGR
ncbi:MAG: helix-turn-helix transcriptional regulator [Bacillota bacterium]|nr:helix-turn-helix transcriptional regulator [Bacillota bacterium]